MKRWTLADAPNLVGRTAVITGANSGLGLASATHLAAPGCRCHEILDEGEHLGAPAPMGTEVRDDVAESAGELADLGPDDPRQLRARIGRVRVTTARCPGDHDGPVGRIPRDLDGGERSEPHLG